MKRLFTTLFALGLISGLSFAQNIHIDIAEEISHELEAIHEFNFEHLNELELGLNMDFNFEMPMDFEINLELPLLDGYGNDYGVYKYETWDSYKSDEDPRKESVKIVVGKEEYDADTEVVIKNINGSVTVMGYDGDEIIIEADKELWKRRGSISDAEAADYELKTHFYEGKLYVYVESPESHVEFRNGKLDYHWHWDDNNRNRINAHFEIEVKVPTDLALRASTVNSGDVQIEKMENGVRASNVNGSVSIMDVAGYTSANTVNGDIEVWYKESPTEDTNFETVNGKIEIYSPEDLSAVVTFESLHGELYTDFEQITRLPNRLNKEESRDGYRYKINSTTPIQIGDGAIEMAFELVNGDVYIRTRKS